MRLLLDEMSPGAVAHSLRALGFDVIAVTERVELRGLPDPELLEWAIEEGRALVTDNVRDFKPLVDGLRRDGRTFPGIVLTRSHALDRNRRAFKGQLLKSLDRFLRSSPEFGESREWWV